jgi:hypothetical protein
MFFSARDVPVVRDAADRKHQHVISDAARLSFYEDFARLYINFHDRALY